MDAQFILLHGDNLERVEDSERLWIGRPLKRLIQDVLDLRDARHMLCNDEAHLTKRASSSREASQSDASAAAKAFATLDGPLAPPAPHAQRPVKFTLRSGHSSQQCGGAHRVEIEHCGRRNLTQYSL